MIETCLLNRMIFGECWTFVVCYWIPKNRTLISRKIVLFNFLTRWNHFSNFDEFLKIKNPKFDKNRYLPMEFLKSVSISVKWKCWKNIGSNSTSTSNWFFKNFGDFSQNSMFLHLFRNSAQNEKSIRAGQNLENMVTPQI